MLESLRWKFVSSLNSGNVTLKELLNYWHVMCQGAKNRLFNDLLIPSLNGNTLNKAVRGAITRYLIDLFRVVASKICIAMMEAELPEETSHCSKWVYV